MISLRPVAPHALSSAMLASIAVALCPIRVARAESGVADECIAAAEQSQPLRHDGKLRAAHEKLLNCSRAECPSVVRADCTKWLADLEDAMPTVVVRAVDSTGADVADVRISVDGEVLTTHLEGKEIGIDPGTHVFRFERGASKPVEQQVVISEAQRRRVLSVAFAPEQSAAIPTVPTASAELPTVPPDEHHPEGRSLTLPIALMAGGGAAVGLASVFWVLGLSERSKMASDCAPTHSCLQSAVDSARGKLVAGDIVGGLGLVGVGVGAGLLAFGSTGVHATTSGASGLGFHPLAGGATIDFAGHF
jgi:hypothetical protein